MPKRFSTAGLTAAVRSTLARTREAHARSRTRTLDVEDTAAIVAAVKDVLAQRTTADVGGQVRVVGGFVPNSYRGNADSDYLTVDLDLAAGTYPVRGGRKAAQRRSGGRGSWLLGRLRKPGQSTGRIVFDS